MVYNFALRYVRIYPGVNSRAELVTLARVYARNGASRRWLGDNKGAGIVYELNGLYFIADSIKFVNCCA